MTKTTDMKFITFEDCRIAYRNFKGAGGEYNREGDRNFCLLLEPTIAEQMAADGFNVKQLKPREEDDLPQDYIQVKLRFKKPDEPGRPPRVVLVTSAGNTNLDEDTVAMLDWVDIVKVDLNIRPYHWQVRDDSGVSAYVRDIYVTIEEDILEARYRDAPDSAKKAIVGDFGDDLDD